MIIRITFGKRGDPPIAIFVDGIQRGDIRWDSHRRVYKSECERIDPVESPRLYIVKQLVIAEFGKLVVKEALLATPPKNERCPTCGEPVVSVFDHVDVDCTTENWKETP